jgi:hypothetical protein
MAQCLEQTNKPKEAMQVYENIKQSYTNPKVVEFRLAELKKRLKKEGK